MPFLNTAEDHIEINTQGSPGSSGSFQNSSDDRNDPNGHMETLYQGYNDN